VKQDAILIATMLGILAPALAAQDTQRVVNLTPPGRVELGLGSSLDLVSAPKCDGSGNVYVRPVSHANGDHFLAPIRAVRQDGKVAGTFSLTEAWPDAVGRGVFVDTDGNVYHAAIAPGGAYVVQFAKDGAVKSKTRLQAQEYIDPWHLVVFESGRFLVSGTEGKNQHKPYTAIFERDGKLVTRIYEPEDEDARKSADSGDAQFTNDAATGNRFVDLGDATLGPHGNAYVLHGTSPALVYVTSSKGEVLRKVRIVVDTSDLVFRSIQSHAGQLAIGMARFGRIEVHIMDIEGAPVESYVMDTDRSEVPWLACYDNGEFTFITAGSERTMHLIRAKH
jgi:hypothetical protein